MKNITRLGASHLVGRTPRPVGAAAARTPTPTRFVAATPAHRLSALIAGTTVAVLSLPIDLAAAQISHAPRADIVLPPAVSLPWWVKVLGYGVGVSVVAAISFLCFVIRDALKKDE